MEPGLAIKFTTEAPYGYLYVGVDDDKLDGNDGYYLEQNTPNPFSSNTEISYSIPQQSFVSLNVYNFKGELVRTLQNSQQAAGKYTVQWNGLNETGSAINPGIYFYRLQTEDYTQARKLLMLR